MGLIDKIKSLFRSKSDQDEFRRKMIELGADPRALQSLEEGVQRSNLLSERKEKIKLRRIDEALFEAIEELDLKKIRQLINDGANVNTRNVEGETPFLSLIDYVSYKDSKIVEICKVLIEAGADINAQSDPQIEEGRTLSMKAGYYNLPKTLMLLIEKGADLNIRDKNGKTVYHLVHEKHSFDYEKITSILVAVQHGKYNEKKDFKPVAESMKLQLRSDPVSNLSENAVQEMLKNRNFFDEEKNPGGLGIKHEYEVYEPQFDKIVFDRTTGLIWQWILSDEEISYKKANKYIKKLNKQRFANYSNWRLPTLEELMSLMEPKLQPSYNHIDPVFYSHPGHYFMSTLFSADFYSDEEVWVVDFSEGGGCEAVDVSDTICKVRAVHSIID